MNKGLLIVLSGPSGVGKGTVCKALRQRSEQLVYSISMTTREPRIGEMEGTDYFFRTRQQFEEMIRADGLLEYAEYAGNYYGTPADFVRKTIDQGKDIILEIEVQGALKIKQKFADAVFVFLTPPSLNELQNRIAGRGTETRDAIRERMQIAVTELAQIENYQYAVINDHIDKACERIQAIITAEHCRKERVLPHVNKWIEEVR